MNSTRVEITILGKPMAKAAYKFRQIGKFATTYNPQQLKEETTAQVIQLSAPEKPLTGALRLILTAYVPIPESTSRKRRFRMIMRQIRPTVKPDHDNCLKFYCDCMEHIIYENDKQIVSSAFEKYYSERPRVEIVIEQIEAGDEVVITPEMEEELTAIETVLGGE